MQGVWYNSNISLDLLQLHNVILDIKNAPKATLDIAQTAENFVKNLFSNFPSLRSLWQSMVTVGVILAAILVLMCLAPCLIKGIVKEFLRIKVLVHRNMLQHHHLLELLKNGEGRAAGENL